MIISRKHIFLCLNFLCFTGVLMGVTDLPINTMAPKFKMVLIVFCFVDMLLHRKNKWNGKVVLIAFVLSIFVLLWGKLFVNPIVIEETRNHCILFTYYLLLLFLSYAAINRYKCLREYIATSFFACVTVLLIQCIRYFDELVLNPIYIFQALLTNMRVRSSFGFLHTNYVGNICYVAIILSAFLFYGKSAKEIFLRKKHWPIILADLMCYFMMISTSSRAAILALVVFTMVWIIKNFIDVVKSNRTAAIIFPIISVGFICFVGYIFRKFGIWRYIWTNSNRQLNISANLPYVKEIGNIWTGMGFVENSAFQTNAGSLSSFGVKTSSLDMYYIYLYCTTGILGCVLIGGILIYILISIIRNKRMGNKTICVAMYLSILFYGVWESVIFSYRFWPMLILTVLLLCAVGGVKQEEKRK